MPRFWGAWLATLPLAEHYADDLFRAYFWNLGFILRYVLPEVMTGVLTGACLALWQPQIQHMPTGIAFSAALLAGLLGIYALVEDPNVRMLAVTLLLPLAAVHLTTMLLALVITTALAYLSWFGVERPAG